MAHDVLKVVHNIVEAALAEAMERFEPRPTVRVGGLALDGVELPLVNVFFHTLRVNENGAKGLPQRAPRKPGGSGEEGYVFLPPSIPLTLSFMVTAHCDDAATELELLGAVMACFQENPRPMPPEGASFQEPLGISPDSRLTPERITKLFESHGAPSRLCVGYVTRIELRSNKVIREAPSTRTLNHKLRRQG